MRMVIKIFNTLEEYALGMTLLALAVYSCIQVFTRYALNYSFTSYEEVARYSCIFITFLGASLGIKYSSHFAMTAVIERLPYRLRHLSTAMVWAISAVFFFVVSYYGFIQCLKQLRFEVIAPTLGIPMYVAFLPIPVFSAVMGGRSLIPFGKALLQLTQGEFPTETVKQENRGETS